MEGEDRGRMRSQNLKALETLKTFGPKMSMCTVPQILDPGYAADFSNTTQIIIIIVIFIMVVIIIIIIIGRHYCYRTMLRILFIAICYLVNYYLHYGY